MKMMIGTKLIGAFMVVALICGIVGFVGYRGMNTLGMSMDEIKDNRMPSVQSLLVIKGCALEVRGSIQFLSNPLVTSAQVDKEMQDIAESRKNYEAAWKIYEPLPQTSEEKITWDKFVPAWEQWRAENNKFMELYRSSSANAEMKSAAMMGQLKQCETAATKANDYLDELVDMNARYATEAGTQAESSQASMTTVVVVSVVLGVILSIALGVFISRGISRPIARISSVANEIAVGDIDHRIDIQQQDEVGILADSFRQLIDYMKNLAGAAERIAANDLTVQVTPKVEKDVLGNAFKTMTTNLTAMIRQVTDNSTQLVSAATEIASSSEQMARGSQEQTGQTSQVSSAVEEMTATIVESSRNAGEAANQAKEAANAATNG